MTDKPKLNDWTTVVDDDGNPITAESYGEGLARLNKLYKEGKLTELEKLLDKPTADGPGWIK